MTFDEIWKQIAADSQLGETRSRYLHGLLRLTANVPGCTAEVGVYRGVTAKLISLTQISTLHLFDTFTGVTKVDPAIDIHKEGDFASSLDSVMDYLGTARLYCRFHPGCFPDTFTAEMHYLRFAFIHSDTDTYHGTKSTLEVFWPRMSPGGIILFDDYRFAPCPGVEKALHEWAATTGVEIMVAPSGGQAWITKQ